MKREDKQKLMARRSYKVVKANDLIQKTRFNLSAVEQKTILYLISKIRPEDTEFNEYAFSISEYCKICGIDYKNGKNYRTVKNVIKGLCDKSVWIELEDGTETLLRWIERPYINKNSGTIWVKIDDMMKPYLLQLQSRFTQYELFYTLAMKSQYSIRLYELLKSYQNVRHKRFDIDELKNMLFAENYTRFPDFKRYVLDTALKEINEFSDLNISYEIEKESRRYARLNFSIQFENDCAARFIKGLKAEEQFHDVQRAKNLSNAEKIQGGMNGLTDGVESAESLKTAGKGTGAKNVERIEQAVLEKTL